jgi:hypothetical protein
MYLKSRIILEIIFGDQLQYFYEVTGQYTIESLEEYYQSFSRQESTKFIIVLMFTQKPYLWIVAPRFQEKQFTTCPVAVKFRKRGILNHHPLIVS